MRRDLHRTGVWSTVERGVIECCTASSRCNTLSAVVVRLPRPRHIRVYFESGDHTLHTTLASEVPQAQSGRDYLVAN